MTLMRECAGFRYIERRTRRTQGEIVGREGKKAIQAPTAAQVENQFEEGAGDGGADGEGKTP